MGHMHILKIGMSLDVFFKHTCAWELSFSREILGPGVSHDII